MDRNLPLGRERTCSMENLILRIKVDGMYAGSQLQSVMYSGMYILLQNMLLSGVVCSFCCRQNNLRSGAYIDSVRDKTISGVVCRFCCRTCCSQEWCVYSVAELANLRSGIYTCIVTIIRLLYIVELHKT